MLKQIQEDKFTLNVANEVIQHCVNIFLRKKILKPEPYRFFLKKDFDTASWSYRPPHYLVFGFDIFKHTKELDADEKANLFYSFVYHELAHSIYTDYRIAKVVKILDEKDLPFSVFNLFEDARIEFKLNKQTSIKFNWTKYMPDFKPYEPLELFYWCVENEGNETKFNKLQDSLHVELRDKSVRVWAFYEKCIYAKNTFEIIDIVEQWMREIKDEDNSSLPQLFSGEIKAMNMPDSLVDDMKEAYEVKTISVRELNENQNDKARTLGANTMQNLYAIKNFTSTNLLSDKALRDGFDKNILHRLMREIEKLFVQDRRYNKTSVPSKKLNIRNVLLKNPSAYKRRKNLNNHKKKITIVLDLSGSMNGVIENMLILIELANILAQRNLLSGNLILCVSKYHEEAQYQTFAFPLKSSVINHICVHQGSEGVAYTMKKLAPILKPCDGVFVFSDGIFADDPLDRDFFHKHNITLFGIYLKDKKQRYSHHKLDQYFDKAIVSDDVFEIVRELVKIVKI